MSQSPILLSVKDESGVNLNSLISKVNSNLSINVDIKDNAQQVNNSNSTSPKSASSNKSSGTATNLMRPYSVPNAKSQTTPKLTIKSISSDQDDIIESILDATERRASWQVVRSQKSYVPSLSAICKYKFYLLYKRVSLMHTIPLFEQHNIRYFIRKSRINTHYRLM
jgi:hypothetical protein